MPAFEAVPVMLPKDKEEWDKLELLNFHTHNIFKLGVAAAKLFHDHEFPSDELAELSVVSLNAAMAHVRSGDLPWLERR